MSTLKLTNEELVAEIQDGHTELMEVLVMRNINLVRRIAHSINLQGVDLDDMIQDGCIGLMESVKTYKPEGGKFSTHAFRRIKAKIMREGNEQSNMIRLPANVVESKMKVFKFIKTYIKDTGIRPNAPFVAEKLNMDLEDVQFIMAMASGAPASLDAQIEGGEGDTMEVMDIVGGKALESQLFTDARTKIIVDFLDELPEMEQQIVIEVLGLRDGVSKTARELDKKIKNAAGDLVSYATVNIRYNSAIEYIKKRIAGEQLVYQAVASKPRKAVVKAVVQPKDETKRDIIMVVSQASGKAYITAELQFSQVPAQNLLQLLKNDAKSSLVANLPDAVALNYTPDVSILGLQSALVDAMSAVEDMGLELV